MWNRNMFNYKILSTVYCEIFTATFFGTKHVLTSRIYILNVWFAAKNDRTTVITILAKFSRTQIKVDVQYSTYIQLKFFILAKVIETKRKINNKFHFQIPYISAEIRLGLTFRRTPHCNLCRYYKMLYHNALSSISN